MVKEYIEREAVADIVFRYSQVASEPPMDKEDKVVLKTLHKILDEVKQASTADVEPVQHGEWVFTGKETLFSREVKCNQCETKQLGETPYCPNCGAKMDGGNE